MDKKKNTHNSVCREMSVSELWKLQKYSEKHKVTPLKYEKCHDETWLFFQGLGIIGANTTTKDIVTMVENRSRQ